MAEVRAAAARFPRGLGLPDGRRAAPPGHLRARPRSQERRAQGPGRNQRHGRPPARRRLVYGFPQAPGICCSAAVPKNGEGSEARREPGTEPRHRPEGPEGISVRRRRIFLQPESNRRRSRRKAMEILSKRASKEGLGKTSASPSNSIKSSRIKYGLGGLSIFFPEGAPLRLHEACGCVSCRSSDTTSGRGRRWTRTGAQKTSGEWRRSRSNGRRNPLRIIWSPQMTKLRFGS